MTKDELKSAVDHVVQAVEQKDMVALVGSIAMSLLHISLQQEEMVELAKADLEAQIDEMVKSRAEVLVAEIEADKSTRSYIGKK